MFNSVVLDVAVALVFLFLAVSLATSSIVEAIASFLKLRSTTLKAGVMDLLNDPKFDGLAAALYAHALINPRGPGTAPALQGAQPTTALKVFAGLDDAAQRDLKARLAKNLPAYIAVFDSALIIWRVHHAWYPRL